MTPQEAAAQTYRDAERQMRRYARDCLIAGDHDATRKMLRLAHFAGVAMVREHRGQAPDEFERPSSPAFGDPAYELVKRLRHE